MARMFIPELGEVDVPDTLSKDQRMAYAESLQDRYRKQNEIAPIDYRQLGIGQLIKGGFNRAASGLGSTVTDLIPALVGSSLGYDNYAKEQLAEAKAKQQAVEAENPTAYKSYKDVQGLGDVPGYVAETFGELGPDILSFIGGAGIGTTAGKYAVKKGIGKAVANQAAETAAKQGLTKEATKELEDRLLKRTLSAQVGEKAVGIGAEVGSKTGLWGAALGSNVPDVFQSVYEDTGELRPGIALTIGPLVAALDTYLPGKMLKQLGPAGKERVAAAMLEKSQVVPTTWKKAFTGEILKTAGGESLTEGTQQALQILGSQIAGDKKGFFSSENVDSIINASIKGLVGGATYGAPGAALEAKRIKDASNIQPPQAQPPAAGAPQLGFTPGPEGYQPDMFQAEKNAAEMEAQRQAQEQAQYRPDFELGQQMPAPPVQEQAQPPAQQQMEMQFEEPAGAPIPNEAQQELGLLGGRTAPQVAIEQQVAQNNEAQLQAIQQRAATARQILDDEIALTDERVRQGDLNRREAARLDLLHPVLENISIEDTAAAFKGNLKRAGYANLDLTDTEKALIQRANDVKAALKEAESIPVEAAAPSQLTPEITGIKEKGEKGEAGVPKPKAPVPPKQMGLPGIKQPTNQQVERNAANIAREEAAIPEQVTPQKTVLDADMLANTGLSKQSGFYKQLLNKDLTNPADQAQVANTLVQVRTNPALAPSTKQAIESVANQAFNALATQQEMFGPKGGVLKGQTNARVQPRVVVEPTGKGVSVSNQSEPKRAERPAAPESRGVERSEKPAPKPRVRKEAEQDTLEPTAEEDFKKQKHLITKINRARKAVSRAEDLSPNSKEKIALRKAEAEYETFEAEARPRADKRIAKLTAGNKKLAEELSAKEQKDIQAELEAELQGETVESREPKKASEPVAKTTPAVVRKNEAPAKTTKVVESKKEEPKVEAKKKAPTKEEPKKAPKGKQEKPGNADWESLNTEPVKSFVSFISNGYTGFAKNDVTNLDDNIAVTELLQKGEAFVTKTVNPVERAAQDYFSKMPRLIDNLINMAYDIVYNTPQFRTATETSPEAKFFEGMNGKTARYAAEWVYANLSPETNKQFREQIRGFERARDAYTDADFVRMIASGLVGKSETNLDETVKDYIRAQQEDLANASNRAERRALKYGKENPIKPQSVSELQSAIDNLTKKAESAKSKGKDVSSMEGTIELLKTQIAKQSATKKLTPDAISSLGMQLHPAIIGAIKAGDLQTALNLLAGSTDGFVAKIAKKLAITGLTSKVVVQENLKDENGDSVPGYYDPKNDTIYIDAETGMIPHVILHEPVHAATSHVLDNPNHPVTKQIQALFNKIKDSLGTAYGTKDIHEFVAESQSNKEFKALLQTINPDGGKLTAWDKFVRIISNFIRRMVGMESRPLESAADRIDSLVDAILSPAPESRDAGLLYAAANSGKAEAFFNKFGDMLEAIPGISTERADKIHDLFKNVLGDSVRSGFLSTLPLNALGDVAKSAGLKMAPEVEKNVNERSGFEYKMNSSIEPLISRAESFAKKESQAQVDLLNEVVYDSTLAKVDPTKDRSEYKTPELQAEYDKLKAKYNKLGGAGRALYVDMRNAYKAMYDQIIQSINERIDASVTDPARASAIKKDILEKLVSKGNIDPYFPLARNGKYWVSYSAKDKTGQTEFYIEAFETERERERVIKELAKDGATEIEKFSNLADVNYRRVPSSSFVNGILQIMEINKVPTEASEEVMRLFLSTLPETAFAQSFQRRKETLGFKRDAVRALREKMYRTSHQIANMRYSAKLNEILKQMEDHARAIGKGSDEEAQRDNRVVNEYVKEFEKRIKYINNPTVDKWSQIASSFGFNMTLGFNVSSAVVNLTQVPLIVMPYLGGKYGWGASMKAINDAYKTHLNSGFERTVEVLGTELKDKDGKIIRPAEKVKQKAMPALDNYNFDDPSLPPEIRRLKTLARMAAEQGQLNRSQLYDILEVDGRKNAMSKINAASGWVFHHGERMNRQVSLIAAYNLELDRLMKSPTKEEAKLSQAEKEVAAANNAIYMAEMTNGGISASSAPRIAQSSLGKVLFMFKRYGVSMYYLLFKTAREALKGETPEIRKAAMQQIAGTYGMAALFAGVQGLPLFGIAAMVYNLFADDDEDDFETATRKYTGEFVYKGLLNYATGLEIASRTGLNDLIIRDSGKQDSQTFATAGMEMLGGPVFGVASKVERGLSMIKEGNVERGIENILPSALSNIMKGIRYATQGTTTLRGDPITGEVNPWNVGAQMFGFAPADYTKQLEINSREKGIDKKVNTDASKFKRQYYTASRLGDIEGQNEAKEKLLELGKKHPGLEINEATIRDVIDASMKQQKRATKEMVHGVRYSGKMRKELLSDAAELED